MRFVLALTVIVATFAAHAEPRVTDGARNLPKADDLVETAGLVQLRESSPDPTFGVKGAQKGWLKAGDVLHVISVKNYISVYGTEIWIEIEKKDDEAVKGWIFAGLAKEIARGKSVISIHLSPEQKAAAEAEAARSKAAADAMARTDALVRDENF